MSSERIELPPDASPGWRRYDESDPFSHHVGPIWLRIADGDYEAAFRVRPVHCNRDGVLHGGMLSTFADNAMGMVALTLVGMKRSPTIHLEMNFVAGAREGDLVRCRSEVVRATRSLTFIRATLTAGETCVATASGIWKNIGA